MLRMFITVAALINTAYAGSIENDYKQNKSALNSKLDLTNYDSKITEIGIERTRCYGICPEYSLIIRRDGTLNYIGSKNMGRIGKHKGIVYEFEKLEKFVKQIGYFNFKNYYPSPLEDVKSVYTYVKINGKKKIILRSGSSGPIQLWALEQLIDKMYLDAHWENSK